jgi:hypothetical protein
MANFTREGIARRLHAERCNSGRHILGLMSHDGDNFTRLERLAGTHDMFNERSSARAVKNFGEC